MKSKHQNKSIHSQYNKLMRINLGEDDFFNNQKCSYKTENGERLVVNARCPIAIVFIRTASYSSSVDKDADTRAC